jgi:Secretion system C-terminal sorting domain
MKNFLHLFCAFSFIAPMSAQTNCVTKLKTTSYVGALSATAADDWTTGWTNFNPKNTAYAEPNDTTTLNGMLSNLPIVGEKNITATLTLDATKIYLLKGFVVVRAGGKLIIPAGTVIRGFGDVTVTPKNYASILVERGGKIEITGTATNPVVMTSAKSVATRDRGDWGGLLIAGKAPHNLLNGVDNNNVQMEGFNNVTFDETLARFGGTDPNDNSGIIRYLRLEFGGLPFEPNKEINGLTLGGVGVGTELNHVQVSFSNDDSYEWFGGTVNSTHLISWKATDDDFDTDNGYNGLNQFGIGVRDASYYDLTYNAASGASTSEGFESDNEATGTASVKPYTSAIFSNYTMIGAIPVGSTYANASSTVKAAFRRGARIRRNSSLRIVNSIFMGYRNFVMIDGDSSVRNTNHPAALSLLTPNSAVDLQTKQISFANNLILNTAAAYTTVGDTTANGLAEVARAAGCNDKLTAITSWVRQTGDLANRIDPVPFTAGTVLVEPLASSTTPNFRPVAGSPALTGGNFRNNPILYNLCTNASEVEKAAFAPIYPNPITNGTLFFGQEVASYGIFDLSGKLIQYGFETDRVVLSDLAKGMYFVKLDGTMQKLVVQ